LGKFSSISVCGDSRTEQTTATVTKRGKTESLSTPNWYVNHLLASIYEQYFAYSYSRFTGYGNEAAWKVTLCHVAIKPDRASNVL